MQELVFYPTRPSERMTSSESTGAPDSPRVKTQAETHETPGPPESLDC